MSNRDETIAAPTVTFSGRIAAVLRWVKAASERWLWPVLAIVFAALFILGVIRPFDKRDNLNPDDVAAAWIGTIGRLGIIPVFPPSEDIQVGDLWAVIADADDKLLLNKAVRIAHIDLRDQITADATRPVFPDTVELQPGHTFRHQDYTEIKSTKSDQISPSIAAFPGITISHSTKASASAASGFGLFSGGRDDELVEEIRIPTAETYGAPAVDAFGKLDLFCAGENTHIYCTDEFIRRALAYVTDDRVLATDHYLARLQISLVIRTYSTREIEQKRERKDSRNGQLSATAQPSASTPASTTANGSAENGGTSSAPAHIGANGVNAALNASGGDETQLALKQVFQRPVVFGFRAISIALPASTPQSGSAPEPGSTNEKSPP
jgi:hypothetical protein